MERYKDNGFCDFLKETYQDREEECEIRFFDIEKSLLVVAEKKDSTPLCLIIDDRVKTEEEADVLSAEEKIYGNECFRIARQADLPLFWIRYVDCEILRNEDEVYLWHSGMDSGTFMRAPLQTLVKLFGQYKIKARLENRTPQKRKNDSLSSAFHLWQRECLWVGIFTDLDLIRMRGGKVVELIELKRSYQSCREWNPYNDDINNFAILSNFCERLGGVDFHILFNTQLAKLPKWLTPADRPYYREIEKKNKGVFYDRIDQLKLYQVERREGVYYHPLPYPVFLGMIGIEDFLNYETYQTFLAAAGQSGRVDIGQEDGEWRD